MSVNPLTAIRQHLAALIERNRAWDQALKDAELRVEAEGYRLVSGGGGGGGDMGWVITDYRSGAVLASGTGGLDEYEAVSDQLESEGKPLYHIDHVGDDLPACAEPESPALPPGLCMALGDWVDRDIDEAAKWLDSLRDENGAGR